MFYSLLKHYARFAIKVYCPYLFINKPELLRRSGPLLLAANHPNTFLDGIILTTLFDAPVYSLARGDVFRHPLMQKILGWLRLLPVYRTTEGPENLEQNYTTFEQCRQAFAKKAVVLIFSEAGSSNEWQVRPVRKGTARLAISSWQKGIQLKVLPVGINYNGFKSFGKTVHLHFGDFIEAKDIINEPSYGKQLSAFTVTLKNQLQQLVYAFDPHEKESIRKKFRVRLPAGKVVVLSIPALLGFFLHLPFFVPFRITTFLLFKNSDHYDSVLTSLLLLFYPVYILLVFLLLYPVHVFLSLSALFVLPFTSWAYMQLKNAQ